MSLRSQVRILDSAEYFRLLSSAVERQSDKLEAGGSIPLVSIFLELQ